MIHHLTRASRHLVFWSLLVLAVSLTVLRVLLASVDSYKAGLADTISQLAGTPVTIGHLGAKMRGFSPELVLRDIALRSSGGEQPAVALEEIRIGLNLPDWVISHHFLASSWVTLVGAKFSVYRKKDGGFAILGLQAGGEQPEWLFQGHKFELLRSKITWYDPQSTPPLTLDAVDLAIINTDQRHKINVLAKLPSGYGQSLKVAADVQGNPFAAALNGTVFAEGRQLKLGKWPTGGLTGNMAVRAGGGDVRFWMQLQHSQLTSVKGSVQLQGLKLARPNRADLNLATLQTDFQWLVEPSTQQWQLDARYAPPVTSATQKADKNVPMLAVHVAGQAGEHQHLQKLAVVAQQLDVQPMTRLVQFFAPEPVAQSLAQANPHGMLNNVTLFANLEAHTGAVNGQFSGLGFAPFLSLPGVDNISGHIKGTDKQGLVSLAAHNARLNWPALFREALVIDRLDSVLKWRRHGQGWALSSRAIVLNVPGLQTTSRFSLDLAQLDEPPLLDLRTALVCDDVSQLKRYFPVGVMKPADIEWLDRAFVQGRVRSGKVSYLGQLGRPLADAIPVAEIKTAKPRIRQQVSKPWRYPSGDDGGRTLTGIYAVRSREPLGGGVFQAVLEIEQLQFVYAPDWPTVTAASAQVRFLQNRMEVSGYQGDTLNLSGSHFLAVNTAIGKSTELQIQGEVDGEIADVLDFLKQTPLRDRIDTLADAIAPKGHTKVSLDLVLPLVKGPAPKVNGHATLNQASLVIKALDLPVRHINGLLKFNEHGVYSDTIKATALNRPVRVHIDNVAGQTLLTASGQTALGDIEKKFAIPLAKVANGELDYRLTFKWPLDDKPADLTVDSDLVGVESQLSGLLAKPRAQARALNVNFGLGRKPLMPITIRYGEHLNAALQFDTGRQKLFSGHILFGAGAAVLQQQAGLKIDINPPQLNLKDWLNLSGAGQDEGSELAIREVNLHSGQAYWGDAPLGRFDLKLKPEDKQWTGQINSAFAVGKIQIPIPLTTDSTVALDMALLDLSWLKQWRGQQGKAQPSVAPSVLSPQTLPMLAVSSYKTLWQSVDLGLLTLQTERIPDGIAIKTLELSGLAQKAVLAGSWTLHNHLSRTQLTGHLQIPNTGQFLSQLEITRDWVGSSATVNFNGRWPGAPQQFALADMQGDVDVKFNQGRILSIDPGLGRVLGVLAMEQWMKRLQLDFRDLYEQGLAFNTIKGHFNVQGGKAVTQGLIVDAIPAKIIITGSADFVNKTIDQYASVMPKGADALPIAGTIMGKLSTLLAHTLTGDDQEGFLLGSQYRLQGPWSAPQVTALHDHDGLIQKLWNGITDFSWLQQPNSREQ
jgi:uncharacterized protein YhdP